MSQTEKPTNTTAAGITPAIAGDAESDPIFAAIAAHRAAAHSYASACFDECDEDVVDEMCHAHVDALKALLACAPTTVPGVVAVLEYLGQPDYGHDPEQTLLCGAIGWDGEIQDAACKLPAILAAVISRNIAAGGQS
jgi:hypothetical protein